MQCEMPDLQPLPTQAAVDEHLYMECPHCNVVAVTRTNWEGSYSFCCNTAVSNDQLFSI